MSPGLRFLKPAANIFTSALLLVFLAVLAAFQVRAQQLDPAFGASGVSLFNYPFNATPPFLTSASAGTEGFLRPDGGITIFGTHIISSIKTGTTSRMRLISYTHVGTSAQYSDPPNSLLSADAAQQPDGKIIAVGSTTISQSATGNWFIERVALDGQVDPTFSAGVVQLDFGTSNERAANVALDDSGRILVSGFITGQDGPITVIARRNPDGTPDPTFGPHGTGFVYLFDGGVLSQKMVLKANGSILLFGTYFANPPLLDETVTMYFQLDPNGSPDPAFGDNGLAYTFDYGQLTHIDVKVRPNGETFVLSTKKYLPAGTVNFEEQEVVLTKLANNGAVDAAFGQGGRVTANTSPPRDLSPGSFSIIGSEIARSILLENNGNIVVAAYSIMVPPARSRSFSPDAFEGQMTRRGVLLLTRYDGNGQLLGKNFSGQTPKTDYVGGNSIVAGIFAQPGGKITVFGTIDPQGYDPSAYISNPYTHIMLARFSSISSVNNANNFYDYNLSGKADFASYGIVPGQYSKWTIALTNSNPSGGVPYSLITLDFGLETDVPAPGDYDGDGVQDLAVFRNDAGDWFTRKVYLNNCGPMDCTEQIHFGSPGDISAPGDFDGDGKTDRAVFRPSEGNWYILYSSGGYTGLHFGQNGDRPVTGDYDDDGKSDVAVIRRENGSMTWFVLQSSNNQFVGLQFGLDSDKAVPADYTGDGRTDIAVWRPSEGNWYVLSSYTDFMAGTWGQAGDIPGPADYDADGKADFAIYRPSELTHYARGSRLGNLLSYHSGAAGEIPIASAYVR